MDWTMITDWLTAHGWRIVLIIVIYAVLYVVMRRLVPVIVRRSVSQTMKKQLFSERSQFKRFIQSFFRAHIAERSYVYLVIRAFFNTHYIS